MSGTVAPLRRDQSLAPSAVVRWFAVDAVVTGANGLMYVAAAGPVSSVLGGSSQTLRGVGAFLLVFAALVAVAGRRGPRALRLSVVAANGLWVALSIVVAATGALDLNGLGRAWTVMQAGVVGALACLQLRSLGRR